MNEYIKHGYQPKGSKVEPQPPKGGSSMQAEETSQKQLAKTIVDELRKCCETRPVIVIEYFKNTKYKMRRIKCPVCGMETQPKRFYADAVREWNHPEKVHTN